MRQVAKRGDCHCRTFVVVVLVVVVWINDLGADFCLAAGPVTVKSFFL